MHHFAPISKMESQDDGTLKVWGIASSECVDNDGEIITAAAMKAALPDYMKWGAVREMHQPIAAGTCLEIEVNDAGQTVICAHVVNESSITKIRNNVLKGFSIGGTTLSTDPLKKTTITGLKLNEISLVDKPANPEAAITLWKADMSKPTQQNAAPQVTGEQLGNEIETLVKSGDMSIGELMVLVQKAAKAKKAGGMCPHDVAKGDNCPQCEGGIAKAAAAECEHGVTIGEDCAKCDGGMAKASKGGELHKHDYTDDDRNQMATTGEAMPDGSFPIKNKDDLSNAVQAYGRAKDKPAAKKHIEERAKALGAESELPDKWDEADDKAKMAGGGDGNELGAGKNKAAASAPVGAAAGKDGTQEAPATGADGKPVAGVAKVANADVPVVGAGTRGPDNANTSMQAPGTVGTANPQAKVTELPTVTPKIGDLVTLKWGEDEIAGEIKELTEGGEFKIVNGGAWLVADSSKLVHHEMVGDKVNWTVTHEPEADFTAAKAAQSTRIVAALKKACRGEQVIQKGMWTVSSWADCLQNIYWLMKDIKWESMSEDDPDDVSMERRIAAWLNAGGQLMLEYAEDELKEMFTGIADPDNICEYIIELAAKPGDLKKFAEGESTVGKALSKLGGAVDGAALASIIEKAVGTAVDKKAGELEKAHSDQLTTLNKRIKELEDTPLPAKGLLKGAAIGKEGSQAAAGEEGVDVPVVKRADGTPDDAATAIKKSFMQPQSFNRLSTQ